MNIYREDHSSRIEFEAVSIRHDAEESREALHEKMHSHICIGQTSNKLFGWLVSYSQYVLAHFPCRMGKVEVMMGLGPSLAHNMFNEE